MENYAASDVYPFHMPGHKRSPFAFPNPYTVDITEIEGFDDLHHPTGEIRKIEEGFARFYGAADARLLVNGSTAGVMAAIFAATKQGDEILLARNCHGCAYRAAGLRGLVVHYVFPEMAERDAADGETDGGEIKSTAGYDIEGEVRDFPGIMGEVLTDAFEAALREHPNVKAAVVTSPTYEGICSDVPALAEIAHKYGVTLIVDAAHGAHLGLKFGKMQDERDSKPNVSNTGEKDFSQNNIWQYNNFSKADITVTSLHKTLPAFTGTALLLIGGGLPVASDLHSRISYYLDCFQTSSPSYLLMASAAKCLRYLKEEGESAFSTYYERLDKFYKDTADLRHLTLLHPKHHDRGKLLIGMPTGYSGKRLMDILREDFSLELEMAAGNYCLAMTSIMDTREGFERLAAALHEIDGRLPGEGFHNTGGDCGVVRPHIAMTIAAATDAPHILKELSDIQGQVSGGFVSVYPPGIPIICPGEVFTEEVLDVIRQSQRDGLTIRGISEDGKFWVVSSEATEAT